MARYRKTSRRNKRKPPVRPVACMQPKYLKRSELPWWSDSVVAAILQERKQ
jgi:hypothetical protein